MKKDINLALPSSSGDILSSTAKEARPEYPTLHLDGYETLDLPKEGTITFKYALKSETKSKGRDGKEKYSCVLEIKKLVTVQKERDERPYKRDTSTEDSLDSLMKEKSENYKE